MKKVNILTTCVYTLFIIISGSSATAQTSFTPSAGTAGYHSTKTLNSIDNVKAYLHEDRSYECALIVREYNDDATDLEDYFVLNTMVSTPGAGTTTATANGNIFPQMSLPTPLNPMGKVNDSQHARARVALTVESTGLHTFTVEQIFGTGSETSTIRCRETTLYGAYNRFFAGTTIVEIENKSSASIPAKVTIIDSSGVKVVDNQSITVNANTRTDVIFADLPANNFGQILITHQAPFGTLSGTVAEYDFSSNGSITLKRERPLATAQRS